MSTCLTCAPQSAGNGWVALAGCVVLMASRAEWLTWRMGKITSVVFSSPPMCIFSFVPKFFVQLVGAGSKYCTFCLQKEGNNQNSIICKLNFFWVFSESWKKKEVVAMYKSQIQLLFLQVFLLDYPLTWDFSELCHHLGCLECSYFVLWRHFELFCDKEGEEARYRWHCQWKRVLVFLSFIHIFS